MSDSLTIQSLTVSRGRRPVVRDTSITIEPGKIMALLGPNGAGKSSLVLTIAGMLKPDGGQVLLGERNLAGKRPEVVRAAGIAAVPEGHQVLTNLNVRDNLLAAGSMHSRSQADEAVTSALVVFPELEPWMNKRAGDLSGGQQQMLALAQALVCKPRFLLADELSFGLAPLIVARLMKVVEEIAESGVGVLLIEQFTVIALSLAQHVYVLNRGEISFSGTPDEIRENPDILQATYLAGGTLSPEHP